MATTDVTTAPLRDPMVHDLHIRVSRLENHDHETRTELAVIKTDMGYVKEGVGKINAGVNRILWSIGLAVLGATVTFILSGGLMVAPQ